MLGFLIYLFHYLVSFPPVIVLTYKGCSSLNKFQMKSINFKWKIQLKCNYFYQYFFKKTLIGKNECISRFLGYYSAMR